MSHSNAAYRVQRLRVALLVASSFLFATRGSAETKPLSEATLADIDAALDAGTLTSEKLVELCLARIKAYDEAGPKLNAILALNPKALDEARALDRERKARGRRSPLHGIPVVLKDNIDTADLPTTGGSVLLQGSVPPDDAFLVKKLRDAGAIVLAKVNMSEFASGSAMSSLGGASLNPHDLDRTPSGSSGGTGVAIAAGYAPIGFGTDTGGSVRGPSTANGIVGLKPTHGLVSRDGIIPLALSFDTVGPMARHVYDVAATLGIVSGVDPGDEATRKSEGKPESESESGTDYTKYLDAKALDGARIGIARDFMGQDQEVDWVIEASLDAMRRRGATVVDVKFPKWFLDSKEGFYWAVRHREFRAQIEDYLKTLGPSYPRTLADLVERSKKLTSRTPDGAVPNPVRWKLMQQEETSGTLNDYDYLAVRDHALPLMRAIVDGVMAKEKLDAIVYPTSPRRPSRADEDPSPGPTTTELSPTNIANLTGFPDLIVPAGFTGRGLPVGISFLGPAFSEPRLLALGYAFEQETKAIRTPVHAPPLPGESIAPP